MLEEVRKIHCSVAKLLGVFESTNTRTQRIQKCVSTIFNVNIVLLNFFYFTNLVEARGITLLQIHISLQWVIVISYSINYYRFTTHQEDVKQCLNWCESFHIAGSDTESFFKPCAEKCTRVVKMTAKFAVYFTVISVGTFQITESLMSGQYQPFLPLYLPVVSRSNVYGLIFCAVNHILTFTSCLPPVYSVMALVFVIVSYSETTMEYLKTVIKNRSQHFPYRVKVFVCTFREMNVTLGILTRLMNPFLMAFEISGYSDLLIVWLVIMFEPQSLLFIIAFLEEFSMFVVICWLNEKLIDVFERMRVFLYEFGWDDLRPKDRKLLLLMMMSVESQKVLRAGPFHRLDFENLQNMINRAYTYGTVLGQVIQGK